MIPQLPFPFPFEETYHLSQRFGARPQFYARWGLKGHNGLDFVLPLRTPVLVVADGKVTELRYDRDGYGIFVKVSHAWGMTLYAHLAQHHVWLGAPVQAGQVLGLSGNTGVSSGPHLHFGLSPYPIERRNGYNGYVDPSLYLTLPGKMVEQIDELTAPVAALGSPMEPTGAAATFAWYQQAALRTWNATEDAKGDTAYLGLSLSGEAGELANLVKKYWRHGHSLNKTKIEEEAGDVLWYLAVLCAVLGIDLGDVAVANERKLQERYPEGFSEERSRNRAEIPPSSLSD